MLLSVLAIEPRGGHVIRRLQQEVQRQATRANHDVTPITMALMAGFQHSKAAHNLSSMLSKDSLNPADIVQLHRSIQCTRVYRYRYLTSVVNPKLFIPDPFRVRVPTHATVFKHVWKFIKKNPSTTVSVIFYFTLQTTNILKHF